MDVNFIAESFMVRICLCRAKVHHGWRWGLSVTWIGDENQKLTIPSHVQNVPVSWIVFCSTTRSMPATDSSTFIIPSTSHPRVTFAMFL